MNRRSKWITLFFVSVLIVVSLGFSYLDFENSNLFDQSLLPQKTRQVFSAHPFLSFVFISLNPITLLIPKFKNSTRAPPIEFS
jgi:hypothetical protein